MELQSFFYYCSPGTKGAIPYTYNALAHPLLGVGKGMMGFV